LIEGHFGPGRQLTAYPNAWLFKYFHDRIDWFKNLLFPSKVHWRNREKTTNFNYQFIKTHLRSS